MTTLLKEPPPFKAVPIILNDRLLQEAYDRVLNFKEDVDRKYDDDALVFSEELLTAQHLMRGLSGFGHDQTIWSVERALVREFDRFVRDPDECTCDHCSHCRWQEREKLRASEFYSDRVFEPALAIIEKAATDIYKKGLRLLRKEAA